MTKHHPGALKSTCETSDARSSNRLANNLPLRHHKAFGRLTSTTGPRTAVRRLEVINSDFSQRTYTSVVIPLGPGGSGVAIETRAPSVLCRLPRLESFPKGRETSGASCTKGAHIKCSPRSCAS